MEGRRPRKSKTIPRRQWREHCGWSAVVVYLFHCADLPKDSICHEMGESYMKEGRYTREGGYMKEGSCIKEGSYMKEGG